MVHPLKTKTIVIKKIVRKITYAHAHAKNCVLAETKSYTQHNHKKGTLQSYDKT